MDTCHIQEKRRGHHTTTQRKAMGAGPGGGGRSGRRCMHLTSTGNLISAREMIGLNLSTVATV